MSELVAWTVYDDNGAPVTGATPTFVDYRDRAGTSRTTPTISELGGGQYGFSPSEDDQTTGVAFLVDNGALRNPRRVAGAITTPDAPFAAWHLEDAAGALWSGVAPTVGSYVSIAGARTSPGIVSVTQYLFTLTPSDLDSAVGVSFRADSPAGAWPQYTQAALGALPWVAPSTGPIKDAAYDVGQFLNGKAVSATTLALATNLFIGQVRSIDRTTAPAVFVQGTGGASPVPYLGGNRSAIYRPTVQVVVRGPAGDDEEGAAIARDVFAWLQQRVVTGYVSWFARDSAPVFLGTDPDQHGQWVLNLECVYRATLD